MINFTDITGLTGLAFAGAAAVILLPGVKRFPLSKLAILQCAVFVLMLAPFGGMPLAAYVRGVTGDLSITTLALLGSVILKPWCNCDMTGRSARYPLLILIVLAALALYPLVLGAGAFDPYRLGYGDVRFVVVLMVIALAAWFRKFPMVALCIAFATLAWSVGWYESSNLWDYLLDPFVAIYALTVISVCGLRMLLQKFQSSKT